MTRSSRTPLRVLIDITAAAEHLDVSTKTIRRHIAHGRLTGYRVGRLIRLDAAEVDALARPIPTRWNGAA